MRRTRVVASPLAGTGLIAAIALSWWSVVEVHDLPMLTNGRLPPAVLFRLSLPLLAAALSIACWRRSPPCPRLLFLVLGAIPLGYAVVVATTRLL